MYQLRIRTLSRVLLLQIFWLTLILLACRGLMLSDFIQPAQLTGRGSDLERMWLTGLRYDLRAAGLFSLPLALAGLALAASGRLWPGFARAVPWLVGATGLLIALLAIGNFYYYQTYHTHFDVFVFGLLDDDTQATLANIWQDYPVVKASLLLLALAATPAVLARYLLRRWPAQHAWRRPLFTAYLIVSLLLLTLICRGSVGAFPLRRDNAQVSDLVVLNKLTPNAVMALDWAIKDQQADTKFEPVARSSGRALLAQAGLDTLETQTPANPWLSAHRPHVVMTLLESFGSNFLAYDRAGETDLLGRLRPHFESDFVFRRFLSEDNGTIPSFVALFFRSPVLSISHSSAQNTRLAGSAFSLYQQAGYRVVFITPGNSMWRNLANYLPRQGVDTVYDQNDLIKRYPEAAKQITDWGVPDEYAYRLAETLLQESKQPLFVTILSVSNHPPYVTPASYQPKPAKAPAALIARMEDGQIGLENVITTFQYAADSYGDFVGRIKASALGSHTILAASGDHQMRRVKASYPKDQVIDRAVPFYLYLPPEIRAHSAWRYDPARIGSHKDILPTLYAYSLPGTRYPALGARNLLAPVDDPKRAFGYNTNVWIDSQGAYTLGDKPVFHPWAGDGLALQGGASTAVSAAQTARLQAFPALLNWYLQLRIKGDTDGQPYRALDPAKS